MYYKKVLSEDVLENSNNDFRFGLEYYEYNDNYECPVDCEWFKTKIEREEELIKLHRQGYREM
jgi:hypothetical protein